MNWQTIFALTNGWALLGWVALAILPRRPFVLSAILYLGVALLCAIYAGLLVALLSGMIDGGGPRLTGTDLANFDVKTLQRLFQSPGGVVVGWTHYLAFDLFVGLWIARDADAKRIGRLVQIPVLFLTLMAGPVGLLIWLFIRGRRWQRATRPD